MSNIYDKASLVLIPSGTKTSKVYSQVPTNGDGDFTFSRSTAATRVNASGNIEKETNNYLLQSNQFDTTWGSTDGLTAGQSGYDGSNNAWLFTYATNPAIVSQANTSGGVQTYSVYAKGNVNNGLRLYAFGSSNCFAYFDLNSGSVEVTQNLIDATIEDKGNGWYRCAITFNQTNTQLYMYLSNNQNSNAGSGSIYIQDAQLEQGLVARDYIETTTTAIYGGITDNVPRLDYTDSSCPALLLEPQRTNLLEQSEFFGGWSINASAISSVVDNYAISPEGVSNASKINFIVQGDSDLALKRNHSVTGGATYCYSIYIKGEGNNIGKDIVIKSKRSGGDPAGTTTIQTLTGDWKRIDFNTTYAANNTLANLFISSNDATSVLVYGAQVEQGSYATSYIPTYGSAVTRNSESCEITSGLNFIGQEQGTMYWDINFIDNGGYPAIFLYDGTSNNRLLIQRRGNNNVMQTQVRSLGSLQADYLTSSAISNGNHKMAVAYATNDFQSYLDGASAGIDSSGTTYTNQLSQISLKPNEASIRINQLLIFKTRLTNAELATLTTI